MLKKKKTMKNNSPKNLKYKQTISFFITAFVIFLSSFYIEAFSFYYLAEKLLYPLFRLIAFISIGLFIGQTIEAAGWTHYIAFIAKPLFRFGKLGKLESAAFSVAFFSGTVANAILFDGYKEGKISKRSLFITNIVNHLPAYFLHLPSTVFIVLPLTGLAGVYYFLITFVATIFRVITTLLFNRLFFKNTNLVLDSQNIEQKKQYKRVENILTQSFWKKILEKLIYRLNSILVFVIPIYTLVFVLNAIGAFAWTKNALSLFMMSKFVPIESLSIVIVSFIAEFTSGFATAGALMTTGVLTLKQTTIALLMGNIVAFPIRALRHQLPRYMGIFSPIMGLQLLCVGQGFRILSLILCGFIFYMIT